MREKIVEAKELKKYYRRGHEIVKALDGVDFEIAKGEMISIVGPSGSGKTTLMNLISCLDKPTSGNLSIAGTDVTSLPEKELINIRRENIGFIFQQIHLIPTLTAKENVWLPRVFFKRWIDVKRISDLLERVGLKGRETIQAKMLSRGDKQRIAIVRALIGDPKLLIADEPTGKLEVKVRNDLVELFRELKKTGLAIFIATHDLELAEMTERIIYLQDGRIVSKEESSLYY